MIPARQIQDLLDKLRDAQISPFAEGDWGLDRTVYELLFEDGLSSAAYKWWMSPGAGWEALAEIAYAVFDLAQHAEGFVVRVWGVTTEEVMQQAVQAGADGMTVNFPDTLMAYLQSHEHQLAQE